MKDIIEKIQDQINVNPLLYICEQHKNSAYKLKNNLRINEIQLTAFKKQFDKYNDLKINIQSKLLYLKSNLENVTPIREIVDNNVIIRINILLF